MIEVKGATFLTSQPSAPAGILIARPDIAEDTGVAIYWEVTNSAQNSLVALNAGDTDFAYVSTQSLPGAVPSGQHLDPFAHSGRPDTELALSTHSLNASPLPPRPPPTP